MAFRPLFRQRALVVPAMAAVSAAAVFAPGTIHAEERAVDITNRKPIYDDMPLDTTAPTLPSQEPTPSPSQEASTPSTPYRPTPTDLLATQIGRARLSLYQQTVRAESALDGALTKTLNLEHSFTSTLRSLAPPPESNERVLPGALYVLVASMAGSIVTRNRNILLRASVPLAVGLTAANVVLPITSRNVGDLVWRYEKEYPVLADAHVRTKERVERFLETGRAHAVGTAAMVEGKLAETREGLEGWVRKGR
ncbi:hypothetical protein IAQ61_010232 [Plenodomus lingam]|nr:hypothetical protein IAQ61_010232 [Plenodomus lingam]